MGTVRRLDQLVYQNTVTVTPSPKPHSNCTPTTWATVNSPLSQTNNSSSCHSSYLPAGRHFPYIVFTLPLCRWDNWHLESLCLAQGLITKKSEFEPRSVWFQSWPHFTTLWPGFGALRLQEPSAQLLVSRGPWSFLLPLTFLLSGVSLHPLAPLGATDNWHVGIYMSFLLLSFSSLCGSDKEEKERKGKMLVK